jgi:hypothetical protein
MMKLLRTDKFFVTTVYKRPYSDYGPASDKHVLTYILLSH